MFPLGTAAPSYCDPAGSDMAVDATPRLFFGIAARQLADQAINSWSSRNRGSTPHRETDGWTRRRVLGIVAAIATGEISGSQRHIRSGNGAICSAPEVGSSRGRETLTKNATAHWESELTEQGPGHHSGMSSECRPSFYGVGSGADAATSDVGSDWAGPLSARISSAAAIAGMVDSWRP
jgi:hypothetical protein